MPAKKKLIKAKQEALDTKKLAKAIANPTTMQAVLYQHVTKSFAGEHELDMQELTRQLAKQSQAIADGDTEQLTKLLASQLLSLNAIFAKFGALSISSEYMKNIDTYSKIALRAQSQGRATAEAISAIQNPPHATFMTQNNISHGAPQQVNNGKREGIEQKPTDPITEAFNQPREAITNG